MQSFQHYSNSLAALRQAVSQNSDITPDEKNAMIGLAYLYGQIGIIQANPTYAPQNEFEVLHHIETTLPKDHVLQYHIKKLRSVLEIHTNQKDVKHSTKQENTKAEHDNLNSQNIINTLHDFLKVRNASGSMIPSNLTKEDNELLERVKKILTPSKVKDSKSPDTKTNADKESDLEFIFSAFNQKWLPITNLTQIIQYLLLKSSDKKSFVQQCLKCYQKLYDSPLANPSLLLRAIPTLFRLFDEHLATGELQKCIEETSFNLTQKSLQHEDVYSFYLLAKAIIFGEKLPQRDSYQSFDIVNVLEFMSHPGNKAATSSQTLHKDTLYFPPSIQLRLQHFEPKIASDFMNFLNKFQKINKRAELFHQRPIAQFLARFEDKIFQLMDMMGRNMGRNSIAFMEKQMAFTVVTLERLLNNLPLLDESLVEPFQKYYKKQIQPEKQVDNLNVTFCNCLMMAGLLSRFYKLSNATIMAMGENKSPSEFLNAMVLDIVKKLLPNISMDLSDQKTQEIFGRIPPERFAKLISASQKMEKNEYREIFMNLLKLDLIGGDVNDFLHNPNQDNKLGKELSQHNARVRSKLVEHKISEKEALEYKKTYDFVFTTNLNVFNSLNNTRLLWDDLQELVKQTDILLQTGKGVNEKDLLRLNAIKNNFDKLKKLVGNEKLSEKIAEKLSSNVNLNLINKILNSVDAIQKDSINPKITNNFFDIKQNSINAPIVNKFYDIAKQAKTRVPNSNKTDEEKNKNDKVKKSRKEQNYYFRVEQWPKERVQTFFLGDSVGCCLATDATQFQAMVQRRMDDAILFHVVVDKETGKPAALAWLYLAETKDGKIVLMANYFEVNAKYGTSPALRLSLLNGILKFTEGYLKDNPAIHGFYMREMGDGWYKDDLRGLGYEINELQIVDKVGGPFVPNHSGTPRKENQRDLTMNKYYLDSLQRTEFYQFNPKILEKEFGQNILPLKKIIQDSMIPCVREGINFKEILNAIVSNHRIALEHFYSKDFDKHPEKYKIFESDMEKWHKETVLAEKTLQAKDTNEDTKNSAPQDTKDQKAVSKGLSTTLIAVQLNTTPAPIPLPPPQPTIPVLIFDLAKLTLDDVDKLMDLAKNVNNLTAIRFTSEFTPEELNKLDAYPNYKKQLIDFINQNLEIFSLEDAVKDAVKGIKQDLKRFTLDVDNTNEPSKTLKF